MAAPARTPIPAQWEHGRGAPEPKPLAEPSAETIESIESTETGEIRLYAFNAEAAATTAPLTSEPPLPAAEPLTSEPPLADTSTLTSESDAYAAGS
ncbi:hypothetical protein ACL07V_21370 [Streptomyces sp. MB22_4]|uniref:hypothetical protein n=1 Tax=unclassified Streptomyces TaxID=2593676 RepID=UPI0024A19C05|nr:hypothetical protein [Streptomyces hygroscopicus]GLX52409.1 hypothetical protein Shyhy01_53590 [Streptomyces hygroscopicus subsp. hygroscopicus]